MAFHRPHPKRISHEPVSNRELELEQVNQALRDELSNEVSINKSNEKYINELEHKYTQCEKEIQSLNKELEWLDNALEEEKAELRSEIVSLKRSLYQAKKEIRDKVSYTDIIEKQLQESEERVQNLRLRFKIISSRRSSPILYNSEEDTDMAHIDPFINITRGLNRLENHFTGGTPLINPVNIIQGMYGTLNTIWANYQRIDQDLDDVTNQRDARDAQIVQLQQDVNHFRQQNIALQNHVNQLTLEHLRLQFEQLGINQAKMARIIHAVLKSSQYKCSKCGKAGHNSRNCSKKKSKSRRSNKSISKKKVKQKGKSSSKKIPKSRKTKQKGVATSTSPDFVNYREPILEIPESDGEEETLNDPMEIDFVQKKKPISLATIECKIKRLKIPAMVLDSGMRFRGGHKFKKSDTITLEPEPSNTYDKNAIKIMVDGIHKAYVAKDENVSIGDLMKKYPNYRITAHGKKNYNKSASLNLEYPWMVCERCRDTLQASRDYDYSYW
ncbi:6662_t:CDS:2 [Entrophospora sp. SA101]|nr:6662_t:CDS:2 [Entrophospora sp. SA101]